MNLQKDIGYYKEGNKMISAENLKKLYRGYG